MDLQDLIKIAKATAKAKGLDPALVCAVCEHESGGWNPWAIRFEPAFYARYTKPLNFSDTEEYARAFSFGLMQTHGRDSAGDWLSGQVPLRTL
jgi:hypothetical protein